VGNYLYRPTGTATEITADTARVAIRWAVFDYDIGYFGQGEWGNYTRTYPAGTYDVWGPVLRVAMPTNPMAILSIVTSGWGTTTQTNELHRDVLDSHHRLVILRLGADERQQWKSADHSR